MRNAFMAGHRRLESWESFIGMRFVATREVYNDARSAFMAGHVHHESWENYEARQLKEAVLEVVA